MPIFKKYYSDKLESQIRRVGGYNQKIWVQCESQTGPFAENLSASRVTGRDSDRILEKIDDSVIKEKYVCDGKLNCQIRCPLCPSKILPIRSANLIEFTKKLPGKFL